MTRTTQVPAGKKRDRFVVILIGVVAGYVVGRFLEGRFGWPGAGMFTMPLGGLIAGVVGRFVMERFRPNSNGKDAWRTR